MNPIVLSEEPVTVYDVKKMLTANKKQGDLTVRAAKCDDYCSQFGKLTQKSVTEIKKAIAELNVPRLKEEHICKIIDVLPHNPEDIKLVLSGYAVTIKNDDVSKINDILAQHR